MSRRDFRVSVAVGCVLLAVLIVYLLVVPGNSRSTQANSGSTPGANDAPSTSTGKTGSIDVTAAHPGTSIPTTASRATRPPESTLPSPSASGAKDPFEVPKTSVGSDTSAASKGSSDADWARLLDGAPVLRSETPTQRSASAVLPKPTPAVPPTDTGATGDTRATSDTRATTDARGTTEARGTTDNRSTSDTGLPVETVAGADSTGRESGKPTNSGRTGVATPATQPAGSTSHVVKPGETLSSIAQTYYGSATLWSYIAKANPTLNPDRLKSGQTLVIPPASSLAPSQVASPAPDKPVATSKQYTVQPGESLYKISMKLWGDSHHVDALYELNKSTIGDNPAKLKVGTLLNLPSPPTVAVAN